MKNSYAIIGEEALIFLPRVKSNPVPVRISAVDLQKCIDAPINWYLKLDKDGRMYAAGRRVVDKKATYYKLHRFILDAPPGVPIDHKDGDGLNNTRGNIKLSTYRANAYNRKCAQVNSKSKIRGVCYHRRDKKWQATIGVNGKVVHLGYYKEKDDAVTARKEGEKKYVVI